MSLDEDEAYIENSRAPLLEHLKELRNRLMVCVVALFIAFLGCFVFSKQVLSFLLGPWETARGLVAMTHQHHGGAFSPDLLLGVLGLKPLPVGQGPDFEFVSNAALEIFLTKVKLSAFGAIVITFPIIAWQLYRFVAPGLYKRERAAFLPFLVAAPILFVLGAALVYYIMLPFVLWFGFNQTDLGPIKIKMLPTMAMYLPMVMKLILAFGLCFQLPVVLTLVALAGIIDSKALAAFRRYAIVLVFVVAAVVTPPDPISQLSLALPLILLYEVSIWCVKVIELRRKREDAEAEAAA